MQIRKRKTFLTLLLSNSLILLLALAISLFTFAGVSELYKDEIKKHYGVEAELDKQVIDSALKTIDEMFYKLSADKTIEKISRFKRPLSNEEHLFAAQAYNEFGVFEFNYMIEDMYIVFPQIDMVIRKNGWNTMRDYYDIYLNDKVESYEAFENMVLNSDRKNFITSQNGEDVFCVNHILHASSNMHSAVAIIDLNEKLLFPHKTDENDLHFLIYEKKLNGMLPVVGFEGEDFDIKKALRTGVYKSGNKQYFVTSIDSDQNSWKYVYLVNMSKLTERMAGLRLFVTIGAILTMVLGVILLLFLTKKQYDPIKQIVSSISKNFGEDLSYTNDYEYIGSIVEKFGEEFKPESVMKRENNVKKLGLLKLLRGESNNETTQKIIEGSLQKKNYMVAVFVVEDAEELFFEKLSDKNNESLARFIWGNVFSEILSDKFEIEMCETDNVVFTIGSDDLPDKDEIYNIICDGQNIIEKTFNLRFSAMLSQFHSGIKSLSRCYREATECLAYRFFSNRGIVSYEEISSFDFRIGYSYTTQQEKNLTNYLKAANSDAAKRLVDEMIDFNLSDEKSFSVSFRCMIYDIVGTIVKTIYEVGIDGEEFLRNLEIFEKIEKCSTIAKTRELLTGIIEECCDFINNSPEKSGKKVIDHIKAFVALNYGDVNLSVSMIANKFDMNANYLSTLFKRENSMALSAYITYVRMEKAKEILKNKHLKIEKVARLCGYESTRTFSRTFTNYAGISPGKYRDENSPQI